MIIWTFHIIYYYQKIVSLARAAFTTGLPGAVAASLYLVHMPPAGLEGSSRKQTGFRLRAEGSYGKQILATLETTENKNALKRRLVFSAPSRTRTCNFFLKRELLYH